MAHHEYEANRAEIVRLPCGEEIVVEHRIDIIAHDCKRPHGEWVADWGGCQGIKGFGMNGQTRQGVIEAMDDKIRRKKQILEIRAWCEKRKALESIEKLKNGREA